MVLLALTATCAAAALLPSPASGARKVITVTASGSAPQRELAFATAICPIRAPVLVGGGFSTPVVEQPTIVTASRRAGQRGWVVKGLREDEPAELTAYAYCRRGASRPVGRKATVPIPAQTGSEATTATARCPRGRRAVAGGFDAEVDFSDPNAPDGALVARSSRSGRRTWSVSGIHVHDGQTLDLTSFVYCVKRRRAKRAASKRVTGEDSVVADTPRCGRTALAGGFRSDPAQLSGERNVILTLESRRLRRAWRTVGVHLGDSTTGTLTSLAYCG
jgi:hypothetical protein